MATLAVVMAACSGRVLPLGIMIGGAAAWLDFVIIRRLGGIALGRGTPRAHIAPLALMKSVILMVVPAAALLMPAHLVDGVSFAIGVSTLPAAIVIDALLPLSGVRRGDA